MLALVIGDSEGGGIPTGKDIAGWQARIQFDPAVLTFAGFQVSNPAEGAQFLMEKASDHTPAANEHLTVVNPQPQAGVGTFDIGSAVLGNPPGAIGSGLLARVLFDCAADGGTCVAIGDSDNSFFTDIDQNDHRYERRGSVSLGVNGGAAPNGCPEP